MEEKHSCHLTLCGQARLDPVSNALPRNSYGALGALLARLMAIIHYVLTCVFAVLNLFNEDPQTGKLQSFI